MAVEIDRLNPEIPANGVPHQCRRSKSDLVLHLPDLARNFLRGLNVVVAIQRNLLKVGMPPGGVCGQIRALQRKRPVKKSCFLIVG